MTYVKNIVLLAVCSALMIIVQVALSVIPCVELVTLLVILYTLYLKKYALISIYIFAVIEGILYGFGYWWFMYLYVWTVLWFAITLAGSNHKTITYAIIAGLYGLSFGFLCELSYVFISGINGAIAWWLSGLVYDLFHGISNFIVVLLLLNPIRKVFGRICYENWID